MAYDWPCCFSSSSCGAASSDYSAATAVFSSAHENFSMDSQATHGQAEACCALLPNDIASRELLVQQSDDVRPILSQHVPERTARLITERLVERRRRRHAIQAEIAKVRAQLAPRGERPHAAPEEDAERAHDAH